MTSYRRGFSLIEIVVSLFIFSILLLLFQAVLQGGASVRAVKNQGVALSVAQNKLEHLRAEGYDALPASGTFTAPLLVTIPSAVGSLTVGDYNPSTKRVTVTVTWQEPGLAASSTVSLATLITNIGGLP